MLFLIDSLTSEVLLAYEISPTQANVDLLIWYLQVLEFLEVISTVNFNAADRWKTPNRHKSKPVLLWHLFVRLFLLRCDHPFCRSLLSTFFLQAPMQHHFYPPSTGHRQHHQSPCIPRIYLRPPPPSKLSLDWNWTLISSRNPSQRMKWKVKRVLEIGSDEALACRACIGVVCFLGSYSSNWHYCYYSGGLVIFFYYL